jgi:hypothetical protein
VEPVSSTETTTAPKAPVAIAVAPSPAERPKRRRHPLAGMIQARKQRSRPASTETLAHPAVPKPPKDGGRLRRLTRIRVEVPPTVNSDDPFAYRACVSCDRVDWLMRTRRDEEGRWKYWCVRCSRGFASDVWISRALKPFVAAAAILLVPIALVMVR